MAHQDKSSEKTEENSDVEVDSEEKSLTLLQTMQSVAWGMLGVQSKKNAKRDLSKGKASHFIVIGIIFAAIFVLTLTSFIQILLNRID